ncbi:hypothetical protein CCP3SC5AM1_2280003 [Gammaproteobacteria bacterium]
MAKAVGFMDKAWFTENGEKAYGFSGGLIDQPPAMCVSLGPIRLTTGKDLVTFPYLKSTNQEDDASSLWLKR